MPPVIDWDVVVGQIDVVHPAAVAALAEAGGRSEAEQVLKRREMFDPRSCHGMTRPLDPVSTSSVLVELPSTVACTVGSVSSWMVIGMS